MKLTKATGAETANFCTTCWRLQQADCGRGSRAGIQNGIVDS